MNEEDNGVVTESSTHQDSKPVDPVVEVEQEAPEAEPIEAPPEGEQPEDDSSEKAPKRPGRRERQLERERQENQRLQAEIARLQGQGTKQPDNSEPKEEDFDNVLDYVKALTKFNAEEGINAYKAEQAARAAELERQELADTYDERMEDFKQIVPDFEQKVQKVYETGLVTPDIEVAVLRSPMSVEVSNHLADNISDLQVLRQAEGNQQLQAHYIRQIEAHLKANPPQAAVRQTRAAAPINPVSSKSATSTKNPNDMTQQEYEAWRYSGRK